MKVANTLISATRKTISTLTSLSYVELGSLYLGLIAFCGYGYFLLAQYAPTHGPSIGDGTVWVKLFNSIYFSAITATSVGYGDIQPHGMSKLFASMQGMFSLFIFAIFVAKPVSERKDMALYHMYKLTLDSIFTTLREGLYIMRKDFDAIIHEAETTGTLSKHMHDNFETALHQGEVLLEDIPTFYDHKSRLYVIDTHRENLLGEAVVRTLERLTKTMNVLSSKNIVMTKRSVSALNDMIASAEKALMHWKNHSSKDVHDLLDRSVDILREMKGTNK